MSSPQPTPQGSHVTSTSSLWKIFAYRDFTLLWASGLFMNLAMSLRTLVSAQWLYDTTGSAVQLGILGFIQLLQMPLALYGGTLADKIDRKKLMAGTQIVSFGSLLWLTILAAAGSLAPWHIFAVTGIAGIVQMLGSAARPAMVPRVVPRGLLVHAVSVQTATMQIASIVAPIIFWWMFESFGVAASFGVSTAIAALSVVSPVIISASGRPEGTMLKRTTVSALKEGFGFVMGHQLLPGLYLLDIGVTVVSFYRQLFPIFADQLYGMGASGTGMLNTANSVGAILGTMLVFYTGRFARKGLLVIVCSGVYAVLLIAFGLVHYLPLGLLIVAGLGLTDAVSMTMRQAIVQLTTPDKLLGRTSSAHTFAAQGANNVGQVEVGFLSAIIGAGATMVIGGFVSIGVVGAIWFLMPGLRKYRYEPTTGPPE
ncbi:MAG: MFS transporter [SAR202 cluster bacterium]|nr:MFS transporter [SAR202 cluster bacterium]